MLDSTFPPEELEEARTRLRKLIRIDTSNPPGDERDAVEWVARICEASGLRPEICGADAARPNLVARWEADPTHRKARPLILSCHLDVVPADPARWTHPPFSGHDDGESIWGRGAIDMKGFAVMALTTLQRLIREDLPIRRDVIFAAVSDEEAGTRLGSRWLVDERPDLLGGDPEYVINEVGGFTVHRNGRRFFPVQVAEKGVAWIRVSARGSSAHSSMPASNSSVEKISRVVARIARARLPRHPSEQARRFLEGFAAPEGFAARAVAPLLAHPQIGPKLLPLVVPAGSRRASLEAILGNTATPTRLRASSSVNVLPEWASADIDGRLAPGQTANDLIDELKRVIGPRLVRDLDWEILHDAPASVFSADTDLYRSIEAAIEGADPEARVVPSIIPGFTDSQNYARLGASCYGFYPLRLPEDLDFAALFHGVDERIPIDGFHWGIKTLTDMLRQFLTE